jgi:hypothetical protein
MKRLGHSNCHDFTLKKIILKLTIIRPLPIAITSFAAKKSDYDNSMALTAGSHSTHRLGVQSLYSFVQDHLARESGAR